MSRPKPVTHAEGVKFAKLYVAGLTTTQIAERVGRSSSAVWESLVRSGVRLRPPGPRAHNEAPASWHSVIPEPDECRDLLDGLSPRQRQVLWMVCRGWTTQQIGRELEMATKTVNNHLDAVRRRLGVFTLLQAVAVTARAVEPRVETEETDLDTADDLMRELQQLRAS